MTRKPPFQFGLATVMWLTTAAAVLAWISTYRPVAYALMAFVAMTLMSFGFAKVLAYSMDKSRNW